MQAYPNYPVHGPTGPLAGELLKVVGDNLGAPKCPGVSRRRLLQGRRDWVSWDRGGRR